MRFIKIYCRQILIFFLLLQSCKESAKTKPDDSDYKSERYPASKTYPETVEDNQSDDNEEAVSEGSSETLDDGEYEATVRYYNPATDYSATYTLSVEVSDGQVIRISFPNDGYLDEDHITPADIDGDGDADIEGEDGKTYKVHIDR